MAAGSDFIGDISPCCCIFSLIAFFMSMIAIAIFIGVASKRGFKGALRSIASETGCTFEDGGMFGTPRVSGNFRGRNIVLDSYTERTHHYTGKHHHDSSTTYTRIQVNHSGNISGEINIYPETFFSIIGKKLGMQDIQTGNPTFDKVFIVKGSSESQVKSIIDLDVQQKLLDLKVGIQILPGRVYFRNVGLIKDKTRLLNILNAMMALAERVEKVR
jgi:hypothetical protein